MQRLATTVAIAAWIGFLGVFALELSVHVVAPGMLAAASEASWPPALAAQFGGVDAILANLAPLAELPIAAVCLAIVVLLARSLFLLHADRGSKVARGEMLALSGIACIALLAGAAQAMSVPLLPIDLDGGLVWLAVALTIAAIGFDRLVSIEASDERETEAEFHAGLSTLAEMMGRQAALYTLPDTGPTNTNKDRRP